MADETGLDFSDQIAALENKYQQVEYTSLAIPILCQSCFYRVTSHEYAFILCWLKRRFICGQNICLLN